MKRYQILWNDNMECASRGHGQDNIDIYQCRAKSVNEALEKFLSEPDFIGKGYKDIYDYIEQYYEEDEVEEIEKAKKDLLGFYTYITDDMSGDPYILWIKEDGKKIYTFDF